jgi:TonB family protein
MRRIALVTAVAVLGFAAGDACAQSEVPLSLTQERAFGPMEKADGAVVERLGPSPRSKAVIPNSPWDLPVYVLSQAKVPRDWARRFAHVMEQAGEYSRFGRCGAVDGPPDSAEATRYRVTFPHGDRSLWVRLDFGRRCAQIGTPVSPGGSIEMESMADTLFALMHEALGQDSVVSRMTATPPRIFDRKAAPWQSPSGGRDSSHDAEQLPEVVTRVPPESPMDARRADVDGTVLVEALIAKSGRVADLYVIKSIPMLDQAAVEAVREWRFRPALYKGNPIAVWVAIPVKFTLH